MKKGANIGRVVSKLVVVILSLYVGGTIIQEFGNAMNCTYSPFYDGLSLIGWTITDSLVPNTNGACNSSAGISAGASATYNNVITQPASGGVLVIVGLIGIASVIMEFVNFRI